MSNTKTRKCKYCSEKFEAEIREINRGNAKFCSLFCVAKHRHSKKEKEPNVECAYCGKEIYRSPSQIKASNTETFFCCREHKDKAQRLESGITEAHPDHYGTGDHYRSYRSKAFRNKETTCEKCERELPKPILHIHHKDGDRTNNEIQNLEVLCPTCHELQHFKEQTGKWA